MSSKHELEGRFGCVNFEGKLVWCLTDGTYNWADNNYPSIEELEKAFKKAGEVISKSIVIENKNGDIACSNEKDFGDKQW